MANENLLKPKNCLASQAAIPDLISDCGVRAKFAWEEFIFGRLRNAGTRRAYKHAVSAFLNTCRKQGLSLREISPAHIGQYLDQAELSTATKKLHLSAIRHLFDELVMRHIVVLNPALSVRAERLNVIEGKTPEISIKQARQLLNSIDESKPVGARDKAVIGIMIYTAVRVGAIASLRRGDFINTGDQHILRLREKGGKHRELPVRFDLKAFVGSYIELASLQYSEKSTPLFRTTIRRTGKLTQNPMTANDMNRMVKRRLKQAGLPTIFSPHSFRVCTLTDLLNQGVPLDEVQDLAGHADPRTTRLYDRRRTKVTQRIVERISV